MRCLALLLFELLLGGQSGLLLGLLASFPLHAPVLEPNFHLQLIESNVSI